MSKENVEIVRRMYESFETGGIEEVLEFLDPEIVWEDLDALPGGGTYRGHEEFRESVRLFYEAFGDLSFTAEEIVDLDETVVVAHRWRGTGIASGTPFDTVVWNVMTLRDGKVVHRRAFADREAAFKAAGA